MSITIQNAIARAIEMKNAAVLRDKTQFMNILEDLAPQLVQERQFISRHYDEKLGLLLYEVYHKKKIREKKEWMPILDYLDKELEANAICQRDILMYFYAAFRQVREGSFSISDVWEQKDETDLLLKEKRQDFTRLLFKVSSAKEVFERAKTAERNGNLTKAINLYQFLEDGSVYEKHSKRRLGQIYEDFPEIALPYYERAAELGDMISAFHAGYMYESDGMFDNALHYYTIAADKGHRGALHNLGYFYYAGIETKQNFQMAFELFGQAAEKGKADSMRNIGVMYENGDYVKKDYEKAMLWYEKAMKQGCTEALADYNRMKKRIFIRVRN